MDFRKIFTSLNAMVGLFLVGIICICVFAIVPSKPVKPINFGDRTPAISNPVFKNYLIYCDDSNYLERRIDTAIIVDIEPRLVTNGKTTQYVVNKDTVYIPYLRIRIKGQQIDWRSDGW